MTMTLCADPIMQQDDVQKILSCEPYEAALLINSVTAKFLQFTGRTVIAAASVTEYRRGNGREILFVRNRPIDLFGAPTGTPPVAPAIPVTVTILSAGVTSDTWTDTALELSINAEAGEVVSLVGAFPESEGERNIKIAYTGGFETVPGDVIMGAVIQMKVDRRRYTKEAGISSMGSDGESMQLDSAGLIRAVRDLWAPYRTVI